MARYSPLVPGKTRLSNLINRYFYWILGAIFIIMLIVGLVCGLVFGLRAHCHEQSCHQTSSNGTSPSGNNVNLMVDLGYSSYKGFSVSNGVNQWLGIRYGAAPVGNLRFRAPQDPPTDNKLYKANTVGGLQ